jgi:hypothetical protein
MRQRYFLPRRRVGPEFVLDVLRDQHRQQAEVDPEANIVELRFDFTVADWRHACDLVGWRRLGQELNREWGLHVTAPEWNAVLEPAGERRLIEVCALIAERAEVPAIEPVRVCGQACASAGAFLVVRSLLCRAGVHPELIRPSTPIEQYASRYPGLFLWTFSKLAPGALPTVKMDTSAERSIFRLFCLCFLAGVLALLLDHTTLGQVLVTVGSVGWLPTLWLLNYMRPPKVEFSSILTFRDLALAITSKANGT